MNAIPILGGGPAGASAALAALGEGREVLLVEKSRFPRHKVCGEFLSPGIAPLLDRLGVWQEVQRNAPGVIRRMALHFPRTSKLCRLPETAFGMSRFRLDQILWDAALKAGARTAREEAPDPAGPSPAACLFAHDLLAEPDITNAKGQDNGRRAQCTRSDRSSGQRRQDLSGRHIDRIPWANIAARLICPRNNELELDLFVRFKTGRLQDEAIRCILHETQHLWIAAPFFGCPSLRQQPAFVAIPKHRPHVLCPNRHADLTIAPFLRVQTLAAARSASLSGIEAFESATDRPVFHSSFGLNPP